MTACEAAAPSAYSTSVSGSRDYSRLEQRLGHRFRDGALLESALTHRSFLNEPPGAGRTDNERLEFLGDAVVDLVVGHLLMRDFPALREGELSIARARVVNEQGLAGVATSLDLGEWLFLGRGEEQSGGRNRSSLLANALEAVVAAVFLDGGYDAAAGLIERTFASVVASAASVPVAPYDAKTELQGAAQAKWHEAPRYSVLEEQGPDHQKMFLVAATLGGRELGRGEGRTKKEAEQRAAAHALATMAAEAAEAAEISAAAEISEFAAAAVKDA